MAGSPQDEGQELMLRNIKRIVIVAGCQRSGTTLVGQILGAHPDAVMIDEPDGLYDWFPGFCATAPEPDAQFPGILTRARSKYRAGQERSSVDPFRLHQNITHIVLKAPNLTYSYDRVAQIGLPVSIVYPVRDARSVVASMAKLAHIPFVERQSHLISTHNSLVREFQAEMQVLNDAAIDMATKRALVWKIKTSLSEKFVRCGLPVLSFKYEDLVANSKAHCQMIADHVGLKFCDQMLRHEDVYCGIGPGGTERFRAIDRVSVSKWQDSLTPSDQRAVMRVAQPLMEELGYMDASDAVSLTGTQVSG